MVHKIKCVCKDGIDYINGKMCKKCYGTGKVEGCEQRQKIMQAFPHLTNDDFHRYESDLYVVDHDGKIRAWLKVNYEFYTNITTFIGEVGTPWAGKHCLDIPFAAFYEKYPELLKQETSAHPRPIVN